MARPLLVSRRTGGILHMSDSFAAREDIREVQRILLITRAHYQALVEGRKDLGPEWHIEAVTKGLNNMSLFLGMAIKHLEER